jgi:alkanesulfonate monooxygenase SsuD/methylene tetrahydromethanopterin reductase-like flavin-dependent oxidoreductase (luciferase family)
MKVGVFGPFMSGTTRATLLEWFRRVDDGPFDSLATGDRALWPNIETQTFLAAAAAATERVRIMSQVMLVPAHPPVLLAKRLASIDVISGGRLVVGVGVGGRLEDYRAADARMDHRWQRLDEHVEIIRSVWRGEPPWPDASLPVGPLPTQPGGPPIYAAASGPKGLARAAKWADGWSGYFMHGDPAIMDREVAKHLEAWEVAGRTTRPYLMHNLYFALGNDAPRRLDVAAEHYLTTSRTNRKIRDVYGEFIASSPDGVRLVLDRSEASGFDEVVFIPITDDLRELDELADIIAHR